MAEQQRLFPSGYIEIPLRVRLLKSIQRHKEMKIQRELEKNDYYAMLEYFDNDKDIIAALDDDDIVAENKSDKPESFREMKKINTPTISSSRGIKRRNISIIELEPKRFKRN